MKICDSRKNDFFNLIKIHNYLNINLFHFVWNIPDDDYLSNSRNASYDALNLFCETPAHDTPACVRLFTLTLAVVWLRSNRNLKIGLLRTQRRVRIAALLGALRTPRPLR